mgnify:CR=1 FL=1
MANKVKSLLGGPGFYAVLALCVLAVGVGGYFLLFGEPAQTEAPTGPDTAASAPVEDLPEHEPVVETVPPEEPEEETEPVVMPEVTIPVDDTPVVAEEPHVVVLPIQGEVLTAFSVDQLLYNETLDDWRTHDGVDIAAVPGSGPDGLVVERDVQNYIANQPTVTPLAANQARIQGIDLSGLTGTGPNGKITTEDLHIASAAVEPAPAAEPIPGQLTRGTRTEAMSGMRKAISRNMLTSKSTNAQTNHRMVVDMTAAVALRRQYKALGIKISYNDIIVRACAKALQDFPIVNASVDGSDIVYHDYVNIGTAVSVPGGLIVPVIRDADIIGLTGIAAKSAELIEKAREGRLTEADYHGGTFTVSSLGMFDLDDFVAIINPPESAILAVGKIAKTPVVVTDDEGEDQVVIKSMCALCLSYDHRIIDGAEAAKFLQKLKSYLQNPILLI